MKRSKQLKAFTLIELLVVIAIIAILAAILFPVFAQAKKAAKKASDVSNVKQLDSASLMYLSDYDDTFPANGEGMVPSDAQDWWTMQPYTGQSDFYGNPYGAGAGGDPPSQAPLGFMDPDAVQNWGRELYPYVKSMNAFVSPGAITDPDPKFAPNSSAGSGRTSYLFNGCASRMAQTASSRPGDLVLISGRTSTVKEAIVSPRRNFFRDGGMHANDADIAWAGFNFSKGANYGIVDGHARFVKRSALTFKALGYWEWVYMDSRGAWINPDTNPTMDSDPEQDRNYWGTWGSCDPSRVP